MPFDHHPRVVVVASAPLDARIREAWGRDNGVLLGSIAPLAVPAPSAVPWDLAIVEYALGDAHRPSSHFCILRDAKPKAPIITVSDAPLEEAIVEALRAGAVDHVSDTRLTTIRAIAERALCAEQGSAPEREPVAQPQHWPPDIRALMQAGIANSPEAILVADREGRVVLANPAAQRLFACPIPLGEGYAALARLGFHHPDGSPVATRDLPLIRAALDGETIHEILLTIPRPDGRTGDLLINASPIYTTDGTLDGGVGVFIDITERKAAETALQRQRAVLAGINRILEGAITCETEEQLGETCLLVALDLTASRAGFVGEIGTGRLPHGLTNTHMGWAHCTMGDGQTASHHPPGGAALHGLYGRVIEAGQSLLANDMPADLDDIGVPSGHPSLASFLGVPLRHAGEIIGVLVVANREGGYTREQQEDLEALAPAVVEALYRKRVELAMRASERRLAQDLARMTRLQALSTRLVQPDDLMTLLQEILAAAAETTGTDKGNIQFVDDDTGGLRIVVHQGLSARFLQHFAEDGCAATCGAAQRGRQRVILEDLRQEPTLRNTQDLLISEAEGIRAVVSTPLITRNGHLLGVLSNHYGAPYQPPKHELRYIDLLARMAADVIERSRTEQALRASETRFRELADAMPQLVWTARPDGVVDYYNQRYVEFAGIRPMSQNPGSSGERWEWESVVHPDDARATAEAWRHAVSTGEPFEIEHHLARGDGSYRWYLSRGVPARDAAGNITRWYCTATDIHATKEAETFLEKAVASRTAALAESEARFRAVFEDAALGIAALDLEGRVLAANPALERLLGRSKDALLGHLLADYGAPGIDREALHERYRELVRGDASTSRGETRWLRADGRARLGQLTTSVVRDTSGAPRFAICMIDDITEERQARAALIQAERLNVTGQLTAAFAHEIKNPLQAAIGCLGLLAEVLTEEGAISDEAQRYLQVARSELHRADRVVNRLREFHRRGNDTPAPTSLVDVVEQVLLVTQKQCEQRFVTARLDVAHEPPLVEARQDELRQVFLNLVFNAIDAMPEGGLLRVAVESTDDPPGVRVAVADNGQGIAAEALPHIFEFLYTTKEQGTGLGLFVCDEIVRHHGGEIAVESVEGAGTTFTVWLPA